MDVLRQLLELPAKAVPMLGSKKNSFGLIALVLIMYVGMKFPATTVLEVYVMIGIMGSIALTAAGVAIGQGLADMGKEKVKAEAEINGKPPAGGPKP